MISVIYEDNHILVCEKPAGIATQAGKITEKDMVSEVNNYLRKAGASSSAYLIHRLDKPVRGILLFAKTKQAAASFNKQLSSDAFEKKYYALVEGDFNNSGLSTSAGELKNKICKISNKAIIVEDDTTHVKDDKGREQDVKEARLKYEVVTDITSDIASIFSPEDNASDTTILDIRLLTGRFHQIRCQLSHAGFPIVGDTLYGSTIPYSKRNAIGLVAYSLSFEHPIKKEKMTFTIK